MSIDLTQSGQPDPLTPTSNKIPKQKTRQNRETTTEMRGIGPTASQQRKDREEALLAVGSLRDNASKTLSDSEESAQNSDSDHSLALFSSVTPQTADEMVDNQH